MNFRLGMNAIDVRDPYAGNSNGPAEGTIPGAADTIALGTNLETELTDTGARIEPAVLISHGGNSWAGNQSHRDRSLDVVALDDVHAAVLVAALAVLDESLKLARKPRRIFDIESQLPCSAPACLPVASMAPSRSRMIFTLIGSFVQLDSEDQRTVVPRARALMACLISLPHDRAGGRLPACRRSDRGRGQRALCELAAKWERRRESQGRCGNSCQEQNSQSSCGESGQRKPLPWCGGACRANRVHGLCGGTWSSSRSRPTPA